MLGGTQWHILRSATHSSALFAGTVQLLLEHLQGLSSLVRLTIGSTDIGGSLPTVCGTQSVLSRLEQLILSSSPIRGRLPDCIWDIRGVLVSGTAIHGELWQPGKDAKTTFFVFEAVRITTPLVLRHTPATACT